MKWQSLLALILLAGIATTARAQFSTTTPSVAQATQARGYWDDPATRLMWAAKDNGKDIRWDKAAKYCRNLRLAEYSDWRLATLPE